MSTILKSLKKQAALLAVAGALAPQFAMAHGGGGGMGGSRSMGSSMSHSMSQATRYQAANLPVGTPPIHHPTPPFYPLGSNIGTNQGTLKALFATGNTSTAASHTTTSPCWRTRPQDSGNAARRHHRQRYGHDPHCHGHQRHGNDRNGNDRNGNDRHWNNGHWQSARRNQSAIGWQLDPTSPPISKNPPNNAPGPVGGALRRWKYSSSRQRRPLTADDEPADLSERRRTRRDIPHRLRRVRRWLRRRVRLGKWLRQRDEQSGRQRPAAAPADTVVQASYGATQRLNHWHRRPGGGRPANGPAGHAGRRPGLLGDLPQPGIGAAGAFGSQSSPRWTTN